MTKKNKIIVLLCWLAVVIVTSVFKNRFHDEPLFQSFKLVVLIVGAILLVWIFFDNKKKE